MSLALDPRARAAGAAMATFAWARDYRAELDLGDVLPADALTLAWVPQSTARAHADKLVASKLWTFESAGYRDLIAEEERVMTRRRIEREKKARWRSKCPPLKVDSEVDTSTSESGHKGGQAGGHGSPLASPSSSLPLTLSLSSSPSPLSTPDVPRARGDEKHPEKPRKTEPRGTRLPENWEPSAELAAKLSAKFPHVDLAAIVVEFRNYWCARPGSLARKLSWPMTFENRVGEIAGRASKMQYTRIVQQPSKGGPRYAIGDIDSENSTDPLRKVGE